MRTFVCLVVAATLFGVGLAAGQTLPATMPAAGMVLQPLAVKVVRELDRGFARPYGPPYPSLRAAGVKLAFAVDYPGRVLDVRAREVTSFRDDKGTDLGNGEPARRLPREKAYVISSTGTAVAIPVESSQTPAEGATAIRVKGTVTLRVGTGTKEVKGAAMALRAGETLETTAGRLRLTRALQSRQGGGFDLVFTPVDGLEGIQGLHLATEDGAALPAEVTVGHDERGSNVAVHLQKLVTTAVVTPVIAAEVKTVDVPVDLTAGIGEKAAASQPAGAGEAGGTVRLLSLAVTAKTDWPLQNMLDGSGQISGGMRGVKLAYGVSYTPGDILQVYGLAIQKLTDDKGTDLGNGKSPDVLLRGERPYFLMPDGKVLIVFVASPKVPAEGATGLAVKGWASLRVGRGAKELEGQTILLRPGRKYTGPEGTLTLTDLAEVATRGVPGPLGLADLAPGEDLEFEAEGAMVGIKSARVTDADGTALPGRVEVVRGQGKTVLHVQVTKVVSSLVLTPTVYEEVKTVQTAIDMRMSVGMPAGEVKEEQP